jgi:cytochrome b
MMTSTTTATPTGPLAARAQAFAEAGSGIPPPGRRIIDAPLRMFHALFGLAFAVAYATGDSEAWRALHVTAGYTLAGLLGLRIVYGLVGPRPARLSARWRRLAGLVPWLRALPRQWRSGAAALRQGEHLAMAVSVLALLALALPVVASGWVVYLDWAGEAVAELHEALASAMLATALTHLALVLLGSVLHRRNQALPMLDGRLPGTRGPDLVTKDRRGLAALLLLAVLAFGAWQWQSYPHGLLPADGASAGTHEDRQGQGRDHGDDDD